MRERITLVQLPGGELDESALRITSSSLQGPVVSAAREDRLTVGLDELPQELHDFLEESALELHIRWSSPRTHETTSPFYSRLPPGLHVFFTPRLKSPTRSGTEVCVLIRTLFGNIKCFSVEESFTSLPADRFSHSSAFQYYQPLETVSHLQDYIRHFICPATDSVCRERVDTLASAVSVDLSYDAISHVLKANAVWPWQTGALSITARTTNQRTEVGLLTPHTAPNVESHELGVGGLLVLLGEGENNKPSPTMFSFPSRHQTAGQGHSFVASFIRPTGLHPTLRLNFSSASPPGDAVSHGARCSLHAYFTLPSVVFPDQYQLADDLFLESKNLTAVRHISTPVDLEAPDYAVKLWGSSMLIELSSPAPKRNENTWKGWWTAEIPLHLRYMKPRDGGYVVTEVPYPAVFWACTAEEGTKFPVNPFDRVHLGYDALFGPRTLFWHVDAVAGDTNLGKDGMTTGDGRITSALRVPVLDTAAWPRSEWIGLSTGVVVILGFAWVLWTITISYWKYGYQAENVEAATKSVEKETKKTR